MPIRIASTFFVLLWVGGCDQPAADIVTGTDRCGTTRIGNDIAMRLSAYNGYPDSQRLWVVQACHSTITACAPVLTYVNAFPPHYAIEDDGTVSISLLGGRIIERHNDEIRFKDVTHPIRVTEIGENVSDSDIDVFLGRIGLSRESLSADLCHNARLANPD